MRLLVCQIVLCAGVARAAPQGGAQRYFGEESLAVPTRGLERPPAGQGVAALGHNVSLAQLEASAALDATPVVDVHVSVEAVVATGTEHADAAARPGPRDATGPALHSAPAERAAENQRSERPVSGGQGLHGLPTGSTDEARFGARHEATTVERSSSSDHQEVEGSRAAGQHADCTADLHPHLCSTDPTDVRSFAKLGDTDPSCESVTSLTDDTPPGLSGCGLCCHTCARLGADCTNISPMSTDEFEVITRDFETAIRKRRLEQAKQEQEARLAALRASGQLVPCALVCHLPEPIHRWTSPLADLCDPDTSLYLNTDHTMNEYIVPEHGHALTAQDLFSAREMIRREEGGCPAALASYDLVLDALLARVEVDASGQRPTVARILGGLERRQKLPGFYVGVDAGAVVPAGAFAALEACLVADVLEVAAKAMDRTRCPAWQPCAAGSAAADGEAPQRIAAALGALQDGTGGWRKDLFAANAKLLEKIGGARGSRMLPPPQPGCATDRECFDSRFVGTGVRGPGGGTVVITPATLKQDGWTQYEHAFDRVVFATCPDSVMVDPSVQEVVLALAKPEGSVILWGNTVADLHAKVGEQRLPAGSALFGKPLGGVQVEEHLATEPAADVLRLHDGQL